MRPIAKFATRAFIAALAAPASAPAQDYSAAPPASQPASSPAASKPTLADRESSLVPGPRYAPLRYDDDFSYLDGGEGTYKPDLFDPIKRMKLGDDWTLRLGGEARGRVESVTHKLYGADVNTQDTLFLHRYYLHADLQYRKLARVYVEGVSAFLEDRDVTAVGSAQNHLDIGQLFVEARILGEEIPLSLRVGRQELIYGKQRMLGNSDWSSVRRTFDAVKLRWSDPTWNIDFFYGRPTEKLNRSVDLAEWDQELYGVYTTYKAVLNHQFEFYLLSKQDQGEVTNSNLRSGDIGDLDVFTAGARAAGKQPVGKNVWDYEGEFAGQWGKFSADTIQAYTAAAETGFTFVECPMSPRPALGIDWASGDDDPFDDIHQTFVQTYPTGHSVFGYADQVGRGNVWDPYVAISAKPVKNVETRLAFHSFWADSNRDALYDASGRRTRRSMYGGIGRHFGNELDWTIEWKVDVHQSLLFGYSHFWPGNFIEQTGLSEDPDLIYLSYRLQF